MVIRSPVIIFLFCLFGLINGAINIKDYKASSVKVKNWKGFQTHRIPANQGITPAFSRRDQGETITNLKSGQLAYWPRSKPGTT
jgi:hypothetical protein